MSWATSSPDGRVHQRFEPDQPHQREAVAAVVDVFAGQPRVRFDPDQGGQRLLLSDARLLTNVRAVQGRQGLPRSESVEGVPQLSVEMETGTGKTYAYLRMLRELYLRYGLCRVVAVVPSVAIREGLASQIRATSEHFDALYPRAPLEARVYQGGRLSDLRHWHDGPGIQLLILNIDAFNKGKGNLIHRAADALGGRRPIELVAAWRPLVVLDEPQNMEGPKAREALASLAACATVRWSATHRHAHHLIHRLDPVQAWDLGLVKRIEVAGVVAEGADAPPIALRGVRASSRGVTARLAIEAAGAGGPEPRVVTVRGADESLQELAGGREVYAGWQVDRVDAQPPRVVFTNGQTVTADQPLGAVLKAATMRAQIDELVLAHLEHERRIARLGVQLKVLSLIFVDRVSDWVHGGPVQGWLHDAWTRHTSRPPFDGLGLPSADDVSAAYFAERRGRAIDTRGRSRDDDAAYELIMRDKARLLSLAEPVRIVVSHSALREGWDNPNVFQICTLHPSRSELRKRQEIGRGLRLPVQADGRRCRDPDVARLVVVANESYERFARELQREVRDDFGVELGARVVDRRRAQRLTLRAGVLEEPSFQAVWARVGRPVAWQAALHDEHVEAVVREAIAAVPGGQGSEVTVKVTRAALTSRAEADSRATITRTHEVEIGAGAASAALPDPIATLQRDTGLTARTLAAALVTSGRCDDLARSPLTFLEAAGAAIRRAVRRLQAEGVRYHPADGRSLAPITDFEARAPRSRGQMVTVEHGVYEAIACRSDAEREWVLAADAEATTRFLFRWPRWLEVPSPTGPLDPGWVVARDDGSLEIGPAPASAEQRVCLMALARSLGATLRPAG